MRNTESVRNEMFQYICDPYLKNTTANYNRFILDILKQLYLSRVAKNVSIFVLKVGTMPEYTNSTVKE
jgi:hypothetical protein